MECHQDWHHTIQRSPETRDGAMVILRAGEQGIPLNHSAFLMLQFLCIKQLLVNNEILKQHKIKQMQ